MLHPHVVNVGKLWGPKRKHGNKRESSFQLVFCMTVIFTYKKIIWIRWIYCSCISRDIPMIIHSTTQWYRISHTILEYVCEFMWIHVNSGAYPLFIPIQLANKMHFSHLFTIELASKRSMFFHVFIPSHGAKLSPSHHRGRQDLNLARQHFFRCREVDPSGLHAPVTLALTLLACHLCARCRGWGWDVKWLKMG